MIDLKRKNPKLGFSLAEALVVMLVVMLLTLAAAPAFTKKRARIKLNKTHGEWICEIVNGQQTSTYIGQDEDPVVNTNGCVWPSLPSTVKNVWLELYSGGGGGSRGSVVPWDTSTKSYNFGEEVEQSGTYNVVYNYYPDHKTPQLDLTQVLDIYDQSPGSSDTRYDQSTQKYEYEFATRCRANYIGGRNRYAGKLEGDLNAKSSDELDDIGVNGVYYHCRLLTSQCHPCFSESEGATFATTSGDSVQVNLDTPISTAWEAYENYRALYQMETVFGNNYISDRSMHPKYKDYPYGSSCVDSDAPYPCNTLGFNMGCLPTNYTSCHGRFYIGKNPEQEGYNFGTNGLINVRKEYDSSGEFTGWVHGYIDEYISTSNRQLVRGSTDYFEPCNDAAAENEGVYCVLAADRFENIPAGYKSHGCNGESLDELWGHVDFYNSSNREYRGPSPHNYPNNNYCAEKEKNVLHTPLNEALRDCVETVYGYSYSNDKEKIDAILNNPNREVCRYNGPTTYQGCSGSFDGDITIGNVSLDCEDYFYFPELAEPTYTSLRIEFSVEMLKGEFIEIEEIDPDSNKSNIDKDPTIGYELQKDSTGLVSKIGKTVKIWHHKAIRNGNSITYTKVLVATITGAKPATYSAVADANCTSDNAPTCKTNIKGYHNTMVGAYKLTNTEPVSVTLVPNEAYNINAFWNNTNGQNGYSTTIQRFVSSSGCRGQNGQAQATLIQTNMIDNPEIVIGNGGAGETELEFARQGGTTRFAGFAINGGNPALTNGECVYPEEDSPVRIEGRTHLSKGGNGGGVSTPNGTPQRNYNFPAEEDIEPNGRWSIDDGGSGTDGLIRATW